MPHTHTPCACTHNATTTKSAADQIARSASVLLSEYAHARMTRTHACHTRIVSTHADATHPKTRNADGAHTVLIAAGLGILAIVVRVGAILCILVVAILRLLPVAILRLLPVCLVAASHDTSTATRTSTRRQAERESERASDRETVCRSNANSTGAAAASRASQAPGDPLHAPAGAH